MDLFLGDVHGKKGGAALLKHVVSECVVRKCISVCLFAGECVVLALARRDAVVPSQYEGRMVVLHDCVTRPSALL